VHEQVVVVALDRARETVETARDDLGKDSLVDARAEDRVAPESQPRQPRGEGNGDETDGGEPAVPPRRLNDARIS
jgi:hypothetical protein